MINIMFCGNDRVKDGLTLSIMSMIKHTAEALNIYVLTADLRDIDPSFSPINQSTIDRLNSLVKTKNELSSVKLIMLKQDFHDFAMKSQNCMSVYTPFAFLRLFADQLDLPNKLLYLDVDIMVKDNIAKLFNNDIENFELAAVRDRYGKVFIDRNYFNSGVMLLNLAKIRKNNLFARVRNLVLTKKMSFPDQTALNKLTKSVLYLPRRFNEQGKAKKDTVIQHFSKRIVWIPFHTINIKPWDIDKIHKRYKIFDFDDIYSEFHKFKAEE